MTLEELAEMAAQAINQHNSLGLSSKPTITIRMPPSKHESKTRYLIGRGGCPRGTVVSRMVDYDVVVFEAINVLAWVSACLMMEQVSSVGKKEVASRKNVPPN